LFWKRQTLVNVHEIATIEHDASRTSKNQLSDAVSLSCGNDGFRALDVDLPEKSSIVQDGMGRSSVNDASCTALLLIMNKEKKP
jgi:hypothetical protein